MKIQQIIEAHQEPRYSEALKVKFNIDLDSYKDKIKGGLSDKKKPTDFPLHAILKGIEVELEHTKDANMALEIALDHLSEDKDYYSKLKKIEK